MKYLSINVSKDNKIFSQNFKTCRHCLYVISFHSLKYKPNLRPSNPIHKPIDKYLQTNAKLALRLEVFWYANHL